MRTANEMLNELIEISKEVKRQQKEVRAARRGCRKLLKAIEGMK